VAVTSRTIVRTGVATFFGGTTYDAGARAYRGSGPLTGSGLSTVRMYQAKRISDMDYVMGQAAGRGMGASMVLEMSQTIDTALTLGQMPASLNGQRHLVYPVTCHLFHLAHQDYAEDAEADVDALDQALHEQVYSDPTLGGICYQAGQNSKGIRTVIDPSAMIRELTATHFRVMFDAEVQIVV
jgi:hypothetical protein